MLTGIGDASTLCVGEGELSLAMSAIVLSVTGVPPALPFTVRVTWPDGPSAGTLPLTSSWLDRRSAAAWNCAVSSAALALETTLPLPASVSRLSGAFPAAVWNATASTRTLES